LKARCPWQLLRHGTRRQCDLCRAEKARYPRTVQLEDCRVVVQVADEAGQAVALSVEDPAGGGAGRGVGGGFSSLLPSAAAVAAVGGAGGWLKQPSPAGASELHRRASGQPAGSSTAACPPPAARAPEGVGLVALHAGLAQLDGLHHAPLHHLLIQPLL
jgi:hypothetical protein